MAKNPKIQYFRTYLKNVIVQFEDYFDDLFFDNDYNNELKVRYLK